MRMVMKRKLSEGFPLKLSSLISAHRAGSQSVQGTPQLQYNIPTHPGPSIPPAPSRSPSREILIAGLYWLSATFIPWGGWSLWWQKWINSQSLKGAAANNLRDELQYLGNNTSDQPNSILKTAFNTNYTSEPGKNHLINYFCTRKRLFGHCFARCIKTLFLKIPNWNVLGWLYSLLLLLPIVDLISLVTSSALWGLGKAIAWFW